MTINVAVATYDAVILGCDSLSSKVEPAFFPHRSGSSFAVDADGNEILDVNGNKVIAYSEDQLSFTATHVMGGVRKMFVLREDCEGAECSIAAVTSGMATLSGVTIAELANRYLRSSRTDGITFDHVEDAVRHFVDFVRPLWDAAPHPSPLRFLVAGYCRQDTYIKVFRVAVESDEIVEQFPGDAHCGAAWDGQSTYASRLISGIDSSLQSEVNRAILKALKVQRDSTLESIMASLRGAGVEIPDDLVVTYEEAMPQALPWTVGWAPIDWSNMPIQTSIELVSALVNAESGMQKFAHGIPTVGGRTRIGLLRRNVPFATLNEPSLTHTHTGYATDA